eukprot:6193285-Pleurochrysis_carterae.AAC.2
MMRLGPAAMALVLCPASHGRTRCRSALGRPRTQPASSSQSLQSVWSSNSFYCARPCVGLAAWSSIAPDSENFFAAGSGEYSGVPKKEIVFECAVSAFVIAAVAFAAGAEAGCGRGTGTGVDV